MAYASQCSNASMGHQEASGFAGPMTVTWHHLYFIFPGQRNTCAEVDAVAISKLSEIVALSHVVANAKEWC